MWKAVETKARKIGIGKTKGRRKERERRKEVRGKGIEEKRKEITKKERIMEVKKVVEEQKIWDEKEEAARSGKEAKKLVPERFYKQIHVFGKKASEKISTKKL